MNGSFLQQTMSRAKWNGEPISKRTYATISESEWKGFALPAPKPVPPETKKVVGAQVAKQNFAAVSEDEWRKLASGDKAPKKQPSKAVKAVPVPVPVEKKEKEVKEPLMNDIHVEKTEPFVVPLRQICLEQVSLNMHKKTCEGIQTYLHNQMKDPSQPRILLVTGQTGSGKTFCVQSTCLRMGFKTFRVELVDKVSLEVAKTQIWTVQLRQKTVVVVEDIEPYLAKNLSFFFSKTNKESFFNPVIMTSSGYIRWIQPYLKDRSKRCQEVKCVPPQLHEIEQLLSATWKVQPPSGPRKTLPSRSDVKTLLDRLDWDCGALLYQLDAQFLNDWKDSEEANLFETMRRVMYPELYRLRGDKSSKDDQNDAEVMQDLLWQRHENDTEAQDRERRQKALQLQSYENEWKSGGDQIDWITWNVIPKYIKGQPGLPQPKDVERFCSMGLDPKQKVWEHFIEPVDAMAELAAHVSDFDVMDHKNPAEAHAASSLYRGSVRDTMIHFNRSSEPKSMTLEAPADYRSWHSSESIAKNNRHSLSIAGADRETLDGAAIIIRLQEEAKVKDFTRAKAGIEWKDVVGKVYRNDLVLDMFAYHKASKRKRAKLDEDESETQEPEKDEWEHQDKKVKKKATLPPLGVKVVEIVSFASLPQKKK